MTCRVEFGSRETRCEKRSSVAQEKTHAACSKQGKNGMNGRNMNSGGSSQQHCVLAIDDEADSLGFLKSALERQGYRVYTAASPQEAIETYRERGREIAMVLLDFLVPPKLSDFVF